MVLAPCGYVALRPCCVVVARRAEELAGGLRVNNLEVCEEQRYEIQHDGFDS